MPCDQTIAEEEPKNRVARGAAGARGCMEARFMAEFPEAPDGPETGNASRKNGTGAP